MIERNSDRECQHFCHVRDTSVLFIYRGHPHFPGPENLSGSERASAVRSVLRYSCSSGRLPESPGALSSLCSRSFLSPLSPPYLLLVPSPLRLSAFPRPFIFPFFVSSFCYFLFLLRCAMQRYSSSLEAAINRDRSVLRERELLRAAVFPSAFCTPVSVAVRRPKPKSRQQNVRKDRSEREDAYGKEPEEKFSSLKLLGRRLRERRGRGVCLDGLSSPLAGLRVIRVYNVRNMSLDEK